MILSETSQTVATAVAEYLAQLEAEIEDLKGANLPLYSDRIKNLEARIAELEAELSNASLRKDTLLEEISDLRAGNAVLRKALEDAPHGNLCMLFIEHYGLSKPAACDCWKAALARIPEVP